MKQILTATFAVCSLAIAWPASTPGGVGTAAHATGSGYSCYDARVNVSFAEMIHDDAHESAKAARWANPTLNARHFDSVAELDSSYAIERWVCAGNGGGDGTGPG